MPITVIYNGYTLPNVYDKVFYSQDYENIVFRCSFFLRESTSSALMTEENEMNAKIREPLEGLQVSFNGNSEFDIDHDLNTALNPSAKVTKTQGTKNTSTTREYEFEYIAKLPADKQGFNFRLNSSFRTDTDDAGRRRVNFDFIYTAGGNIGSRENFDTFAEPFALGIIAAIGGNYERISKNSKTDDQDKFTSGSFIFQEILEGDLDSTINDSRITNVSTQYSVDFGQTIGVSLTDNYIASPQNRVNINYKVKYNKEEVNPADAGTIYNQEIKPYIIQQAFTRLDLLDKLSVDDFFITEDDGYSFNPNDYSFTGRLSFLAPESREAIISYKETLVNNIDDGVLPLKIWDQRAHSYALYNMGTTERFSRTIEIIKMGSEPVEPTKLEEIEGVQFTRLSISRRKSVESQGIGDILNFANDVEFLDVWFVNFSENYLRTDRIANQEVIVAPGEEPQ